ncbi:MAG: hypothetical protein L3K26_00145 [Candidatus Hydrogenedentes bacterium]|nr:hypothetical protein [Candidatus Hydrogenedentota bacterium]
MTTKRAQLVQECRRLSESCLYTSTSLFIWLRCLRIIKACFIALPLLLGSIATWEILTASDLQAIKLFLAAAAFLAGLLPSIYSALKFDDYLSQCVQLAGEYKNLQDRFRFAAVVSSKNTVPEFEQQVQTFIDRLEQARSPSFTAPEWCFRSAQAKIQKGDYYFDVDQENTDDDS